jgi:hypothetical protein
MMSSARKFFVVCIVALAGCASGKTAPATEGGGAMWTGSFRQPQVAASSVIGPAATPRGAAYGTLKLSPVEGRAGSYQVDLSMSAPVEPSTQLAWAVFQGPCGATSTAVTGINEFPMIEITSGGGTVRSVMAFTLDPRGTYHANVYWSSRATDVSNVMMCAKLEFSGAR